MRQDVANAKIRGIEYGLVSNPLEFADVASFKVLVVNLISNTKMKVSRTGFGFTCDAGAHNFEFQGFNTTMKSDKLVPQLVQAITQFVALNFNQFYVDAQLTR